MAENTSSAPWWARVVTPRRVLAVIALAVVVAAALSTRVLSIEQVEANAPVAFDAAKFASSQYDSVVVPYISDNATDLPTLVTALADGADPAEFGNSSGSGNAFAFPVVFTAIAGEATPPVLPVTVTGMPSGVSVVVQIGPVMSGTAIRDVAGTISFNQFTNQIEFQNVGIELNNLVKASVLEGQDFAALEGKTITVTGAFLAGNPNFISVVPISIEVAP